MKTTERRMEILFLLVRRRSIHLSDLQSEFRICKRTAIQDIQELSRIFPIYTEPGRFGGIFLAKEYHLGMKYLTDEQCQLLEKLSETLAGEDLALLKEILKTFRRPA